ncbi:MAG: hypothetical protein FWF86_07250, partial [Clostridia bacterium]|nr:hypothetical protein [Clostridia bacterium]
MRNKLYRILALTLCVMLLPAWASAMSWNDFIVAAYDLEAQSDGQTVLDRDTLGLAADEEIEAGWGRLIMENALLKNLVFQGTLYLGDGIYVLENTKVSTEDDYSGIDAYSGKDISITVDKDSQIGNGKDPFLNDGIGVYGDGNVTINNRADIDAAWGIYVSTDGNVDITNSGNITSDMRGISAYGKEISIVNSGDITSELLGIGATGTDIRIMNSGDITSAQEGAIAVDAYTSNDSDAVGLDIHNSGNLSSVGFGIQAGVNNGYWEPVLDDDGNLIDYQFVPSGEDVSVKIENTGDIVVESGKSSWVDAGIEYYQQHAYGIEIYGHTGNGEAELMLKNSGDITLVFEDNENADDSWAYGSALGVSISEGESVDITVINQGSLSILNSTDINGIYTGNEARNGTTTINNSGDINGGYVGINAGAFNWQDEYGSQTVDVTNSGEINAQYGIDAWAHVQGDMDASVSVNNSGNIQASETGIGAGAYTENGDASASVKNSGNITVDAKLQNYTYMSEDENGNEYEWDETLMHGTGISAHASSNKGNASTSVDNSGKINVTAEDPDGEADYSSFNGIDASAYAWEGGSADTLINNKGSITVEGPDNANGISTNLLSAGNSTKIINDGKVTSGGAGLTINVYDQDASLSLSGKGDIKGGTATGEDGESYGKDIVLTLAIQGAEDMSPEELQGIAEEFAKIAGLLDYQNGHLVVSIYDADSYEFMLDDYVFTTVRKTRHAEYGGVSYSLEWLKQAWLAEGSRDIRLYRDADMEERVLFKEKVSAGPNGGEKLTPTTKKNGPGNGLAEI